MEIGVLQSLENGGACFDSVSNFGLGVCQLVSYELDLCTQEVASRAKSESESKGVRVCAFWAGLPGPMEWNFENGPLTLGIVAKNMRAERLAALKRWADFAVWMGVPAIITHCGFIPENMSDPLFGEVVEAIREIALYCKERNIEFWFETGQETPVVLLRTIEGVGTDNLGINLDPANLIMYGKGNPIDALDTFGKYVRNIHVKDGLAPTNGRELGAEVPAGQGLVRFPEFLAKLKSIGYDGELIIEREISGEQQALDIRKTIDDLRIWQK